MTSRIRIAAGAALAALAMSSIPASAAGVPVIDAGVIARAREAVSVATKQLAAVQQQTQQVQQMRNTLGQVGPGMLGKIMDGAKLDFASPTGTFKDVSTLSSQVQSITSQAGRMKIKGEAGAALQPITDLVKGREAAAQLFFYNGSEAMNGETIGLLRDRRNSVLRESALSGYGTAASFKADLVKSQETAQGLATQAKDAADLRGDVQANTAATLAVYSELVKQTALQAQMLEIQSSTTLSADSVGRRGK